MRCAACRVEFKHGDEVQRVPPIERALRGEKSGVLGIYPMSPEVAVEDQDLLHNNYSCYEQYFSPLDNPFMYDALAKVVECEKEGEIYDEVREDFTTKFEMVKEMVGEQNFNFCVECWADLEVKEPPVCLWCKSPDFVWLHEKLQGTILCCTRCGKYWDDQEEELFFPPSQPHS
jgi:hypothetical protein